MSLSIQRCITLYRGTNVLDKHNLSILVFYSLSWAYTALSSRYCSFAYYTREKKHSTHYCLLEQHIQALLPNIQLMLVQRLVEPYCGYKTVIQQQAAYYSLPLHILLYQADIQLQAVILCPLDSNAAITWLCKDLHFY